MTFHDQLRLKRPFPVPRHLDLDRPDISFGEWPDGVPVQIHGMDNDPIFVGDGDIDAAKALTESSADAELFMYSKDQHHFADSTLPSCDANATAILMKRVLDYLEEVTT